MRKELFEENKDGSNHFLYFIEGMSERILAELWALYMSCPKFPLSVVVAEYVVELKTRNDLYNFYLGLELGIEMNRV